jgi:ribose-phosphate pyrophosphokinase
MNLQIASGKASLDLATAVAVALGAGPVVGEVERFPDGELRPVVSGVRGDDVYLVQSTGPPVNDCFVELLLLIDACRRAGAGRVTAVVPYFGYARQDHRTRDGQAIGARVAAEAIAAAGADRVVVIDPHSASFEAMFAIPVEALTAVAAIADTLIPGVTPDAVVVAPDLGAVKLAERYASLLGLPVVVVRKTRVSGSTVRAEELVGHVDGRSAVVVDDMIATGATVEAAVELLLDNGARHNVTVAATHGLFVGDAVDRLRRLPLGRLVVTDSLGGTQGLGLPVEMASIATMLTTAIHRLHGDQSVDELLGGS